MTIVNRLQNAAADWKRVTGDPNHVTAALLDEAANFILSLHNAARAADTERLVETNEHQDEAEKWKSEGDMYGWNFHQGYAAGTTAASIIFHRLERMLENAIGRKS